MESQNVVIQKLRSIVMAHRTQTEDTMAQLDSIATKIAAKQGTPEQYTSGQKESMISQTILPLESALQDRNTEVDAILENVLDALSSRYLLRGDDITPDIQLLGGAFDLSEETLKELISRHRDNVTMASAIKTYMDRKGVNPVGYDLRTYEDEEKIYTSYANSAKSWIHRMTTNVRSPTGRAMMAFVDDFGLYIGREYEVIGDGEWAAGLLNVTASKGK